MPTPPRAAGTLLDRLDALVALAQRRRGLVLTPAGALARAEARSVARAAGLPPVATGEAGLLAALAVAVGLLRQGYAPGGHRAPRRLDGAGRAAARRAAVRGVVPASDVDCPTNLGSRQAAAELRLDLDQLVREAARRMPRSGLLGIRRTPALLWSCLRHTGLDLTPTLHLQLKIGRGCLKRLMTWSGG